MRPVHRQDCSLGARHRDALRVILAGGSVSEAARQTGMGITTVHQLAHSPAGRRYLDRERDRIDAHRTLLAATLPFMALLNPHTLNKSVDIARNIKEIGDKTDRKSTRLNSSHSQQSRMPSSA